ncbi:DNA-deoxyinosine glycosylase [Pelotomaculum isophthalicicum JI]|uniref:DNA-deoxyinosine glycosylase n=1 Tax=Pelotomaculum isophthalicicum JI TaxID=947010 RepID=A0A9X4JT76_9FIRM|nr:DNA-deoxyinosine glycosylase [Pelotomaculum isophthalicicum]MDF9408289.1 DNA-deoxyinosine glycosylase [Pelotomaculum isophthalicicum JI]
MPEISSFNPIVDNRSKVLILGTMPGPESLRQNQYYANANNKFWNIIYEIFGRIPDLEYEKKVIFLLNRRIALWDVLDSCSREGALDANITNGKPNNFLNFFEKYSNIEYVFFNGTSAYKLFKKYSKQDFNNIRKYIILPSTSPTPGRYVKPYKIKLSEWITLLEYMN